MGKSRIVFRERSAKGAYLVQRINNCGHRFCVNTKRLARFGSHDETEYEIKKRIECDKHTELVDAKDCTIEKMQEDGNCLFRAVERQVCGDPERFRKVQGEVVDYVIIHKNYFSSFDTNIEKRLSEQLINRT